MLDQYNTERITMNEIDVVAYKVESFDSDCFKEDLIAYSSNSIILMFNKNRIWVAYKPEYCKIKKNIMKFLLINKPKVFYNLYPLLFIIDHFRIFYFFLSICLKYRVKVVLIENTYVAAIVGVLGIFNLFQKMIYLPGDWLAGDKTKKGIRSYIGSNIMFPFFDYLACRLSDITLNGTKSMADARYNYWGRSISKKELIFLNRLEIKTKYTDLKNNRNKIVFIGNIREDSGLELIIKSLNIIRKSFNITLKIVGANNKYYTSLNKLAEKYQVEQYIEFVGFVDRDNFEEVFSDCFCGINLLMTKNSYTSKTLPAKVFDYLQYLLPVIITENIGPAVEIVQSNKFGLVIEPSEDKFVEALINIYKDQELYRKNIVNYYINSLPTMNINDFFTANQI